MSNISDYAVTNSIVEMANYIAASAEYERGIIDDGKSVLNFDSTFESSDQLRQSIVDCYTAISRGVGVALDLAEYDDDFDCSDRDAWVEARKDRFGHSGWVHRIANIIEYTSRRNHGVALGDASFHVVMSVARKQMRG